MCCRTLSAHSKDPAVSLQRSKSNWNETAGEFSSLIQDYASADLAELSHTLACAWAVTGLNCLVPSLYLKLGQDPGAKSILSLRSPRGIFETMWLIEIAVQLPSSLKRGHQERQRCLSFFYILLITAFTWKGDDLVQLSSPGQANLCLSLRITLWLLAALCEDVFLASLRSE